MSGKFYSGLWALPLALWGASLAEAKPLNFERAHVSDEMIVRFHEGTSPEEIQAKLDAQGAKILHKFESGFLLISLPTKGDAKMLATKAQFLSDDRDVASVEANQILRADEILPDDADFAKLYGLRNLGQTGGTAGVDIKATEAWEITTGSRQVLVGVIDSGIDHNHPDLGANMWINPGESGLDAEGRDKSSNGIDDDGNGYIDDVRGWDFANNDNNPMDDNGHGTHCAGTIGGVGNNGVGVTGVNWQVSMVGLKFLDRSGAGALANAVKAIEYANRMGATLTSNSWGGGGYSEVMRAAITSARDKGVLFIAAAGNSASNNDTNPHYPSNYNIDNVISVAATDSRDGIASFSCFGAKSVHLGAPGVGIWSLAPNNRYVSLSGTSMATPHVSGVAALIKAAYPDATAAQIKARLINSVDPISSLQGKTTTGGRLNALSALENDSVAPGPVAGLEVTATALLSIKLRWLHAGDDGDLGRATRYELRWSKSVIDDEASWNAATPAKGVISITDEDVTAEITGLDFNTQGYVAVKAIDNVGNIGALSSSVPFQTKAVRKVLDHNADSMGGVRADAPWGIETINGNRVFSDSPNRKYGNKLNVRLTFDPIAIAHRQQFLSFEVAWDLETNYDFAYVELSVDGGKTWKQVGRMTGKSAWTKKSLDLSSFIPGPGTLQLRFRLISDNAVVGDGLKIDNVTILSAED